MIYPFQHGILRLPELYKEVKMSKEDKKDVKCTVSKEVWKRLKIISVQKEISLPELAAQVLEAFANKKKFDNEETAL